MKKVETVFARRILCRTLSSHYMNVLRDCMPCDCQDIAYCP